MALRWKKHRISQLVADLQSPAKRRGSMVVETGFPASLVDLFVKNRDRLRRTSSKKHAHRRRGIDIASTHSPPIEVPVTITPRKEAIGGVDSDESFANRVSASVLKAFVVVALALTTKKLVFGITLSAFALLLLEYVGNYIDIDVGLCLKPCERVLDLIQRGPSLLRLERSKTSKRLVLQESDVVCESVGEIESVGDEAAGSGCVIVEREQSCVDMRMAVEGNEDRGEEGLLYVKNQSRSQRIKSKIIKKCVQLRDLRRRKKKSTGTGSEEDEWIDGSEKSGYLSIEDCEEDKLGGVDDGPQIPCEVPREKPGRGRREGNSGYEMLILIALVGLVGGRIWGFVFTVVWCLALKSLGNQGTVQNVPMIRSLVSIRR